MVEDPEKGACVNKYKRINTGRMGGNIVHNRENLVRREMGAEICTWHSDQPSVMGEEGQDISKDVNKREGRKSLRNS